MRLAFDVLIDLTTRAEQQRQVSQEQREKTSSACPRCVTPCHGRMHSTKLTIAVFHALQWPPVGLTNAEQGKGEPESGQMGDNQINGGEEVLRLCANTVRADGQQGGKNRRRGKNENDDEKRELVFKEEGQGERQQHAHLLCRGAAHDV